jgi:hypothetical protein
MLDIETHFIQKITGETLVWRPKCRWENNIKIKIKQKRNIKGRERGWTDEEQRREGRR